MRLFLYFLFTFAGCICLSLAFPEISTKQYMGLCAGITCMIEGIYFFNHDSLRKEK